MKKIWNSLWRILFVEIIWWRLLEGLVWFLGLGCALSMCHIGSVLRYGFWLWLWTAKYSHPYIRWLSDGVCILLYKITLPNLEWFCYNNLVKQFSASSRCQYIVFLMNLWYKRAYLRILWHHTPYFIGGLSDWDYLYIIGGCILVKEKQFLVVVMLWNVHVLCSG